MNNNMKWVAPPNWPAPQPGWSPPPGWQPSPEWGPAPDGWQFWQPVKPWNKMSADEKKAADPVKAKAETKKGFAVLAGIALLVGGCVAATGGDEQETVTTASQSEVEESEAAPEEPVDPAKAAADKAAKEKAAAEKAATDKAAADKAAKEAAAEEAAMGTPSQQQAYDSALQYLGFSAFSRAGLIGQLSSEFGDQFPVADAEFAVARIEREGGVDWNEQAAKAAKQYLETSSFSRQGLIDQLASEFGDKYTREQAEYGVNQTGL